VHVAPGGQTVLLTEWRTGPTKLLEMNLHGQWTPATTGDYTLTCS